MRRPWEEYWEESIDETTFLRGSKHEVHPVRDFIALLASDYDTVFEGGCATAVDLPLHEKRETTYMGLDITEKFILRARELYPERWLTVGSMMKIPLDDKTVDTAYTKAVLEHMHPLEWPDAVRELWRISRRQMIIAMFGWDAGDKKPSVIGPSADLRSKFYVRRPNVDSTTVFNNPIPLLDLQKLIHELGAEGWIQYKVGGKMGYRTKFKPYMVYLVKKR